jgi:hypothetical protein
MDLVKTLTQSINETLVVAGTELTLAKKAMGIKPNLTEARQRIQSAGTSYVDMLEVILKAEHDHNVKLPEPLVSRIDQFYKDLAIVTDEVVTCENIIAIRAQVVTNPKQKHALN